MDESSAPSSDPTADQTGDATVAATAAPTADATATATADATADATVARTADAFVAPTVDGAGRELAKAYAIFENCNQPNAVCAAANAIRPTLPGLLLRHSSWTRTVHSRDPPKSEAAVKILPFADRSRKLALLIVLCAAGSALSAAAQPIAQIGQNALRLVVVNDQDAPVPLADVIVQLGQLRARGRTDSSGVFRVNGLPVGDWHATVRRIGYGQSAFDLHIVSGDNSFTITVDASAAALKDVNVVEKRTSVRLVDFENRKARGEPSAVITREQIDKRNPVVLSQMFRTTPGLQMAHDQGLTYPVAARGSVPKNGATISACPMRIAIDGVMRPPLTNIDDVIPSDVHGVEIYYGPASLPMQLATFRTDKWCGLVAIWTRDR